MRHGQGSHAGRVRWATIHNAGTAQAPFAQVGFYCSCYRNAVHTDMQMFEVCLFGALVGFARSPPGIKLLQVYQARKGGLLRQACNASLPFHNAFLLSRCQEALLTNSDLDHFSPCGHTLLDSWGSWRANSSIRYPFN